MRLVGFLKRLNRSHIVSLGIGIIIGISFGSFGERTERRESGDDRPDEENNRRVEARIESESQNKRVGSGHLDRNQRLIEAQKMGLGPEALDYPEALNMIKDLKEIIGNRKNPGPYLYSMMETIGSFPKVPKQLLVAQVLNELIDDANPLQSIKWLEKNRDGIFDSLNGEVMLQGLNMYDLLIDEASTKCQSLGIDFTNQISQSEDPDIKKDFAPLMISTNGIWKNNLLEGLDKSEMLTAQRKTLERLVLRKSDHAKALSMLLDPDCQVHDDEKVVAGVLDREWFWDNREEALRTIESSPAGEQRDNILARAVVLISEIDRGVAAEWIELSSDEETRALLLSEIAE